MKTYIIQVNRNKPEVIRTNSIDITVKNIIENMLGHQIDIEDFLYYRDHYFNIMHIELTEEQSKKLLWEF
jgi:hypothetical protein